MINKIIDLKSNQLFQAKPLQECQFHSAAAAFLAIDKLFCWGAHG